MFSEEFSRLEVLTHAYAQIVHTNVTTMETTTRIPSLFYSCLLLLLFPVHSSKSLAAEEGNEKVDMGALIRERVQQFTTEMRRGNFESDPENPGKNTPHQKHEASRREQLLTFRLQHANPTNTRRHELVLMKPWLKRDRFPRHLQICLRKRSRCLGVQGHIKTRHQHSGMWLVYRRIITVTGHPLNVISVRFLGSPLRRREATAIILETSDRNLQYELVESRSIDRQQPVHRRKQPTGSVRRTREANSACYLVPLNVTAEEVGLAGKITFPEIFPINYCSGDCQWRPGPNTPLFTNNAIMRNHLRTIGSNRDTLPAAQCAAILYKSLTIYYVHDGEERNTNLPDITVTSCACR